MSQQSKAKERQGYDPRPMPQVCGNCRYFRFEEETLPNGFGFGGTWTRVYNLRCAIGGFAVKKMATCNEWKEPATTQEGS